MTKVIRTETSIYVHGENINTRINGAEISTMDNLLGTIDTETAKKLILEPSQDDFTVYPIEIGRRLIFEGPDTLSERQNTPCMEPYTVIPTGPRTYSAISSNIIAVYDKEGFIGNLRYNLDVLRTYLLK